MGDFVTAPSEIAGELAAALGLPKETIWFELRVATNEAVIVRSCHFVKMENFGEMLEVVRKHKLKANETSNV